jgi:hypothetical protein
MNINNIQERLVEIATKRLSARPFTLRKFEHWIATTMAGRAMVASEKSQSSLSLHIRSTDPEASASVEQELQMRLAKQVDAWIYSQPAEPLLPTIEPLAAPSHEKETQAERRARRYKLCLDAGLVMPTNDYSPMPRGIGAIAEKERVRRQTFVADMRAHIKSLGQM